ncbi:MAG: glycoside hydrolase family 32 protein [Candidatus Hydrogenedentes bacterium]|nr:glycoside hydrolase family 32 protein [Candidatus Hydrogenedentota bacterium]
MSLKHTLKSFGVSILFFVTTRTTFAEPNHPDLLVADFEGANYGAWTSTGDAFGVGPAHGTLPGQMEVTGFHGHGLVNSFQGGDAPTGTLTSPPFSIERRFINFLVGGGKFPGKTCIELVLDGAVVRSATGPNDSPGGSERLDWASWDVSELAGKNVVIRITDAATGGWGHINVDQIVQSDSKPPIPVVKTREISIDKDYVWFPVTTGAPKVHLTVEIGVRAVRAFDIELAPGAPEFWTFLDAHAFKGARAILKADRLPEDSKALDAIVTNGEAASASELYHESLRPQFHFTARRGWLNDPNGLVFHDGEYHLFFQHNPYGRNWGNMHWGHAVSPDLLHWKELPDALYPDDLGTIFSGSAVVDLANTAGFNKDGQAAIVCIYTAAGGSSPESQGKPFSQCIAYSTDRGRSWTKYAGNPVLNHIVGGNRDPKVIWHEPTRSWVMALYLDGEDYALFGSPDLKQWNRLCDVKLPGASECPEFFEIPLDGNRADTRWVFYGANGRYLIGRFDGRSFAPESGPYDLNHGNCYYASQTYNNLPTEDGRRIQIAWGQVDLPSMPFNQMMDFPVELTLRSTPSGPRLHAWPVREIASLYSGACEKSNFELKPGENPLADVRGELFDVSVVFAANTAESVTLSIRGVPITYNVAGKTLTCGPKSAPLAPVNGRVALRVIVDRASIEIFADEGALYMPMGMVLSGDAPLSLSTQNGSPHVEKVSVHELRSIWTAR